MIVRANAVSTTTTVIPPPTNPQTSNATLEYDLTNRLTENGTTCTYEWGPMLVSYGTDDTSDFNYSSTSSIDVYVFSSDYYHGAISCTLGPILHARENKAVYTMTPNPVVRTPLLGRGRTTTFSNAGTATFETARRHLVLQTTHRLTT